MIGAANNKTMKSDVPKESGIAAYGKCYMSSKVFMKIFLIAFFVLSFTAHGKADPSFAFDFPDRNCFTDEVRVNINNQFDEYKHSELVLKLRFYLKIRASIISDNAINAQRDLDFEMFFLISRVLSNAKEADRDLISKVREQLIQSPLDNNDDLTLRIMVPLDSFLADAI
ncbi:hypothetical protein [Glaciecola sp. MF2-115]|uniref:hypothetical protein n=1 Tax=Glaciecola sp. MF2-115 TaxID=3384827 RepID=UPI00399EF8C3